MTQITDLVPSGSVVLLKISKEGEKRLLIFGVKQSSALEEEDAEEFDYIGVLYTERSLGEEFQYLSTMKKLKNR